MTILMNAVVKTVAICLCIGFLFTQSACSNPRDGTITPDDPNLVYRGTAYPQVTAERAELLRFSPKLLEKAQAKSYGFNPMKARSTANVSLSFRTNSPEIALSFDLKKRAKFEIMQNGQLSKVVWVKPGEPLMLSAERKNEASDYRVVFPLWDNPIFLGLQLSDKHTLEPVRSIPQKAYVAIGDSITHGRGQNISSETWGAILAKKLDMEYYNLAVGGSSANMFTPQSLESIPNVELVSILWGYNDWNFRGKTPAQFGTDMEAAIDVVREYYPDTKIALLQILQTTNPKSKKTDFKIDDFRVVLAQLAQARQDAGDENLVLIKSDAFTNQEDDLNDKVHLSVSGAAKLAEAIFVELNSGS